MGYDDNGQPVERPYRATISNAPISTNPNFLLSDLGLKVYWQNDSKSEIVEEHNALSDVYENVVLINANYWEATPEGDQIFQPNKDNPIEYNIEYMFNQAISSADQSSIMVQLVPYDEECTTYDEYYDKYGIIAVTFTIEREPLLMSLASTDTGTPKQYIYTFIISDKSE